MTDEMAGQRPDQIVLLVHPITGEPKRCFTSGNFMYCNFTTHNGKVWRYSKTKDFLKFLVKWRRKRSQHSEELLTQIEKEPASKQSSQSID